MNKDKYRYYLGPTDKIFCGYSKNARILSNCASGGIVSTVFMWLLENNIVDGCLVYSLCCSGKTFTVTHKIVTSSEDLITSGGSIYMDFAAITRSILDEVRNFQGKIAVVGLPCSINALARLKAKDEVLNKKIVFTLGLFCGHTSKRSLIETVLQRKDVNLKEIEGFSFRKGLWRGNAEVLLKSGDKIRFPSTHFTTYQNLFVDAPDRCLRCQDHYAENADLSTGDIWKKEFKKSKFKHSIFTTRNTRATKILEQILDDGQLHIVVANKKLLFQANKRAAVFHKAIRARALVGKLFGYKIPVPRTALSPRINEIVAAFIVFPFIKLSGSSFRNVIFAVPRKFLYVVLLFFKLLTNF